MENGNAIKSWGAHGGGVESVRYARDGRIVTAGRDKLVKLWDGAGNPVRNFDAVADVALRTAFTNDDGKVIAGDWTGQVVVWTAADGTAVGQLSPNPPTRAERLDAAQKDVAAKQAARDQTAAAAAASQAASQLAAAALAAAQKAAADAAANAKATADAAAAAKANADKANAAVAAANGDLHAKMVLAQAAGRGVGEGEGRFRQGGGRRGPGGGRGEGARSGGSGRHGAGPGAEERDRPGGGGDQRDQRPRGCSASSDERDQCRGRRAGPGDGGDGGGEDCGRQGRRRSGDGSRGAQAFTQATAAAEDGRRRWRPNRRRRRANKESAPAGAADSSPRREPWEGASRMQPSPGGATEPLPPLQG